MRRLKGIELDDACEDVTFCAVCQTTREDVEVTDNVCEECLEPSDELRFSQMENPNWCCSCCLVRTDVLVERHVCSDCKL